MSVRESHTVSSCRRVCPSGVWYRRNEWDNPSDIYGESKHKVASGGIGVIIATLFLNLNGLID